MTFCRATDILSGTFPSRAQGFLKARGRFLGLMYATSFSTDVYHLLASDESHTLCGLSVAPIIIDRAISVPELHLTTRKPVDREECTLCAKSKSEVRQND